MSTRTRIVLEIDGRFMAGKEVKPALIKYGSAHIMGFRVPLPFDLEAMKIITAQLRPLYQRVGLHVFREPRRVRDVRSRYKRIVLRYGLGRRRGGSGSRGGRIVTTSNPAIPGWMQSVPRQSLRVPAPVPEQPVRSLVDWGRIHDSAAQWAADHQTSTLTPDNFFIPIPEPPRG